MPYTAATVPDNVPKKYAAQFAEVWNSSYKAAKADKKSDADAEASAFAQAHGVINKSKAKDARDVSADGPGFGPTEKKNEDGGQVSDPQQSLRDNPNHDEKGQFASGGTGEGAHTTEEHLKAASTHVGKATYERANGSKEAAAAHLEAAHKHVDASFAHAESKEAAGKVARDASHAANIKSIEHVATNNGQHPDFTR